MFRRLVLLQCAALLILAATSLPVDDTAKNTGDTVKITPIDDKLPETADVGDLDDLDKIIPDTVPDQLPEFGETAKNPGDTVDTVEITPIEDKLPKPGAAEDNSPKTGAAEDNAPKTGAAEDNAPKTGAAEDNAPKTGAAEDNAPKTGDAEDNAPKTGQSLEDLDKIIPELLPDLPDLPKLPDVIPKCKKENETCSGFPSCCSELQCYWEKGLSFVKKGVCVPCVPEGLSCYRSGQCCGNNDDNDEDPDAIICDKATNPFEDGVCAAKRTSGRCYKNKQCKGHKCDKKWYRLTGNCVA